MSDETVTLKEAAEEAGVKPETLRRWARSGVIPGANGKGEWPRAAVAQARLVARLRDRGHSLQEIREAAKDGRLAYGFLEDLFPESRGSHTLAEVADQTGLEEALVERIWTALGFPRSDLERLTDEDLQATRYIASVIDAGFPLVAFLQLVRVYGQAVSRIADAEVRLFHLYVHEPLMRDGVPGLEMAEEMEDLA
ncbi:MAG: adenylate cyclase, partial [Thermoleophilaceae bacterium]|nr:adenylate cyclase [Thermoleophilaceae bacterium]